MGILTQNTNEKQETIKNILRDIPMILIDGCDCLYYLVRNLSEELDKFISTGKTDVNEFDVLPEAQQREMADHCERLDLSVTYHRQQMEYMNHKVTIKYPRITNPKTDMSVSTIPWFILPDRPYPIFIYVYAAFHYYGTGKKSLRLSAAAAVKMFGIESLNKSTVSRSIKIMERIFNIVQIDRPLSTAEPDTPPAKSMEGLIEKILGEDLSMEQVKEIYGDNAKSLTVGTVHTENIPAALSGIPHEYCEVIKERRPAEALRSDKRQRQTRERRSKPKKPLITFIEPHKIERMRIEFINICKNLVMDAATTYRQFLQ